jgi:hypothetical protein
MSRRQVTERRLEMIKAWLKPGSAAEVALQFGVETKTITSAWMDGKTWGLLPQEHREAYMMRTHGVSCGRHRKPVADLPASLPPDVRPLGPDSDAPLTVGRRDRLLERLCEHHGHEDRSDLARELR